MKLEQEFELLFINEVLRFLEYVWLFFNIMYEI